MPCFQSCCLCSLPVFRSVSCCYWILYLIVNFSSLHICTYKSIFSYDLYLSSSLLTAVLSQIKQIAQLLLSMLPLLSCQVCSRMRTCYCFKLIILSLAGCHPIHISLSIYHPVHLCHPVCFPNKARLEPFSVHSACDK